MRFHSSHRSRDPAHRLERVLDADPDLGSPLSPERRAEAAERLVARSVGARAGTVADRALRVAGPGGFGLLVLDGVLAREILFSDNVSVELLGAGDVIQQSAPDDPGRLLRSDVRWTVVEPARLAILGSRFAAELTEYPEVTAMLFSRLVERSHRLGVALAIAQLNGVDRRALALFWHLAERRADHSCGRRAAASPSSPDHRPDGRRPPADDLQRARHAHGRREGQPAARWGLDPAR